MIILLKPILSVRRNGAHEPGGRWYRQTEAGECFFGSFKTVREAWAYTKEKGDVPVVDTSHVTERQTLRVFG